MGGFAWDAVVVACITGGLGLVGVLVTVRGARRSSTRQHIEQTAHLIAIQQKQSDLAATVDSHRRSAEETLSDLKGRVCELSDSQNALFQMVVEVDQKVTSVADKRNVRRSRAEVVDV